MSPRKLTLAAFTCALTLSTATSLLAEDPFLNVTKEQKMEIVTKIHKRVVETSKEKAEGEMKDYETTIPGTEVKYTMLPIKGGEFTMGSPESEADRGEDEGPQVKVKLDPFWMGKFEVTWDEYELFMYPAQSTAAAEKDTIYKSGFADVMAVAHPTKPYVEMSFSHGKGKNPALSMTQHGALYYCQWLSAKTGHFYRLPTEAEWEYACRAGTKTAYSFGDDAGQLGDYAWFVDNSDFKPQKVGLKKPNPWGLHDMHGNVAEWCLDQYAADAYKQLKDGVLNPWNKATKPYPHVVRGGGWEHDPDKLRSAARLASDPGWKTQDPQLPKSVWYHTDAQFLGFRIVRPLKVPSVDEMYAYWNSGVERE